MSWLPNKINFLEKFINDFRIVNPHMGLPEEFFLFVSRMTPIVNVDLLIKDELGRTLLAWRDDQYAGQGWHLPGGIIRFKETFEERLIKVSEMEIGSIVSYDKKPIALNEVFPDHDTRGHFVSILYDCKSSSDISLNFNGTKPDEVGFLQWHNKCPDNIVEVHEMYREFIDAS